MTDDQSKARPESTRKTYAPVRMIGVIVLTLGLVSAGLVYGLSKPPEDLPGSLGDPAAYKTSSRVMEDIYGKSGSFSYWLTQNLEDPTIQAAIIAIGTVIVAGGCFWVAEMRGAEIKSKDKRLPS